MQHDYNELIVQLKALCWRFADVRERDPALIKMISVPKMMLIFMEQFFYYSDVEVDSTLGLIQGQVGLLIQMLRGGAFGQEARALVPEIIVLSLKIQRHYNQLVYHACSVSKNLYIGAGVKVK